MADFPSRNESPYGAKVKAYIDETVADAETGAASALAAHEDAPDPHPQYVLDTEKGANSGVATLDSGGKVPDTQIPAAIARDSEVTAAIAAQAAVDSATYAALSPAALPKVYVSTSGGSDTANGRSWGSAYATLEKALTVAAASGGAHISLSWGNHTRPTSGIPNNTVVEGMGAGLTVITTPNGTNASTIKNSDQTNGNTGIHLRHLTVDGNKANQSGAAVALNAASAIGQTDGSIFGIDFRYIAQFSLLDVEARNVDGKGIALWGEYNGSGNPNTSVGSLINVRAYGNGLEGIHIGRGMRRVLLHGVQVYDNLRDGIWLDASEMIAAGVYAYRNSRDGIYVRNVFSNNLTAMTANRNGRHGFNFLGMVESYAQGVAHSNGRYSAPNGTTPPGGYTGTFSTGGHDAWLNGDTSWGYGVTDRSKFDLVLGPVVVGTTTKWDDGLDPATPTESYCLYIDDTLTLDVHVNVHISRAGANGDQRLPATTGNLLVMGHAPASSNLRIAAGSIRMSKGRYRTGTTPAPTIANGAGVGTSPPAAALHGVSGDMQGQVQIGTGTSPAAGVLCTVTFSSAYPEVPIVVLTPANAATAALPQAFTTVAAGSFTVELGSAPAASQAAGTYKWNYHVIGR